MMYYFLRSLTAFLFVFAILAVTAVLLSDDDFFRLCFFILFFTLGWVASKIISDYA